MTRKGLWEPTDRVPTPGDCVQWVESGEYLVPAYFGEKQIAAAKTFLGKDRDLRAHLGRFAFMIGKKVEPLLRETADTLRDDLLALLCMGRVALGDKHTIADGATLGVGIDFEAKDPENRSGVVLLADQPALDRIALQPEARVTTSGYVGLPGYARGATINLRRFLKPSGEVDVPWLACAADVLVYALEATDPPGARPLCIGVCGLAELLLAMAIPYDSDRGRQLAQALFALIHASALRTSALLGATIGPFPGYVGVAADLRTRFIEMAERTVGQVVPNPQTEACWLLVRQCLAEAMPLMERSGIRHPTLTTAGHPGVDLDLLGGTPGIAPLSELPRGELALFARAYGLNPEQTKILMDGGQNAKVFDLFDQSLRETLRYGEGVSWIARIDMAAYVQVAISGAALADLGKIPFIQLDGAKKMARNAGVIFLRAELPPATSVIKPEEKTEGFTPSRARHLVYSTYDLKWGGVDLAVHVERPLPVGVGRVSAQIASLSTDMTDQAVRLAMSTPDLDLKLEGYPITILDAEIGNAASPFEAILIAVKWALQSSRTKEALAEILELFP